MNKNFIFIIVITLVVVATGIFYFLNKPQQTLPIDPVDCYDCGKGGWQKMSVNCGQQIIAKNDFKGCLINFSWSSVNQNMSLDDIKEGYIEIGGLEVLNAPTPKSIKVLIYNQWAVDIDGNLYLFEQLG